MIPTYPINLKMEPISPLDLWPLSVHLPVTMRQGHHGGSYKVVLFNDEHYALGEGVTFHDAALCALYGWAGAYDGSEACQMIYDFIKAREIE